MRRKNASPTSAQPKKRQRTSPRPPVDCWAHAEWFQSTLDEPFFASSEFTHVITTALGLTTLLTKTPTRLQLARIRAAMCNAFPGGFATPRRFSAAFLAAEVKELALYRADARRLMRGAALLPATDPTTGDSLPQQWWSRYRCPPPLPPHRGAHLLVRTCSLPRHTDVRQNNISFLVTIPNQASKQPSCDSSTATRIRPAVFLSLEGEDENRVRFTDDGTEHTVPDLDVMLQNPTPQPEALFNASPSSLLIPNLDRLSPGSGRFSFSSSPLQDIDFSRFDAPSQLVQLYSSPRPILVSPQRPVEVKARTASHVECEVDVQQVAESMRLLDRKQELLLSLRSLNDMMTARSKDADESDESATRRYRQVLQQIEDVDAELQLVMQSERRSTPTPSFNAAFVEPSIPQPSFDTTPDGKQARSELWPSYRLSPKRSAGKGIGSGSGTTLGQSPALRPEHMAKNVDFRNATGAALLAKALTRAAFAKLSNDSKLKMAATSVRADVMECVSACVAVLVRARATRDYHCIEELIDGIRVRFPENAEAIEAIHEAARSFDSTSSEST